MSQANGAITVPPIQPGRVGNLSDQQKETVAKFKELLTEKKYFKPERHDDHLLLRFLRARKFDLQKASEMFINCENWRTEKKVDEIFETWKYDEDDKVQVIYPRFYHKIDKYGRPIYVEMLGNLDLDQLFKTTTRERLEINFIYEYEKLMRVRLPACSQNAGYHIETSCTILDLKNCSIMQAFKIRDLLKLVVDIGQNYYPETMGMTFIINAPWLFDTIWNIVKMWLDEVTVAKFKIFRVGKDGQGQISGGAAAMFEFVDPANLPFKLGGACQCPEGCEKSDAGPWKN